MNLQRRTLVAVAASVLAAGIATAQAPANRYTVVYRFKIEPGKRAELMENVRTNGVKIAKEWLKTNPNLVSWRAMEVAFTGNPMPDYDFSLTIVWNGAPPEDASSYQAAVKAAGLNLEEYQAKTRTLRKPAGSQLRRLLVSAPGPGGDYAVVSYYKASPGQLDDCIESMRTVSQPVYAAMVKDGAVAGWGSSLQVFPRGQSQAFDFTVSTVHKTLAQAAEAGGSRYATYFAKVHPGKSYIGFVDSFRRSRTLVRTDLLHTIAYVSR